MPPKKPDSKKASPKLKQLGASGMAHVEHVTDANRFKVYLKEVNNTTGEPHPNKVELDKIKDQYMDWYDQVDLSDLEMAYYGLLFSTNQIYTGANEISAKFRELLDNREPDSYLEYYKLVIMGNWLVKNNRLDSISYHKLLHTLDDINPASYVVCKPTKSNEVLDLHSSLCYLNNLLHLHNPAEYGTDLLPNDCPPLAELPPTQGTVNQAKLNNTNATREAIKQGTMSYSKVAAIPKSKVPSGASGNKSNYSKTKKKKPLSSYTPREKKEYYKANPDKRIRKKDPKKEAKRLATLQKRNSVKQVPQAEYVESTEEADVRSEAKADKNSENIVNVNSGPKALAAERNYDIQLKRIEKRASKTIKRARGDDLHNLKLLINRVGTNANKVLINKLLSDYGHLLDDTELINEYLTEIHDVKKREHQNEVIEDAKGLLNKLKQGIKTQANNAKQDIIVVTETPKPANNAPTTIQEAANVISNSYGSETESEADMSEFERPVHRLQQGKTETAKVSANLNASKKAKALKLKARSKHANSKIMKGRSRKVGNTTNN